MKKFLELIKEKKPQDQWSVRLGVRLVINGHETLCPISGTFENYQTLSKEMSDLKETLEVILTEAKEVLPESSKEVSTEFNPDLPPEEIWARLSAENDDDTFILAFNGLPEDRRRLIAEHVLTQCNIFTGRASFFSSRYDQYSGILS